MGRGSASGARHGRLLTAHLPRSSTGILDKTHGACNHEFPARCGKKGTCRTELGMAICHVHARSIRLGLPPKKVLDARRRPNPKAHPTGCPLVSRDVIDVWLSVVNLIALLQRVGREQSNCCNPWPSIDTSLCSKARAITLFRTTDGSLKKLVGIFVLLRSSTIYRFVLLRSRCRPN